MSTLQDVIDKIAKLRRLATSTNVNEAAAAAAAADKLMQEHGIAEAQLEASGEKDAEPIAHDPDPLIEWTGRRPGWQRVLAARLAHHYGCSAWGEHDHTIDGRNKHIYRMRLVGRASDIASVRYMYAWLVVEIERLAQQRRGHGRSWLDSFRCGAVDGVTNALYRAKKAVLAETATHAGTSTAITLVENRADLAKAERDRIHPDLRKAIGSGVARALPGGDS